MLRRKCRKYITFSVPSGKKLYSGKTIAYKLKFIDSFRFLSTSFLNLINSLSETYNRKCRYKS